MQPMQDPCSVHYLSSRQRLSFSFTICYPCVAATPGQPATCHNSKSKCAKTGGACCYYALRQLYQWLMLKLGVARMPADFNPDRQNCLYLFNYSRVSWFFLFLQSSWRSASVWPRRPKKSHPPNVCAPAPAAAAATPAPARVQLYLVASWSVRVTIKLSRLLCAASQRE